MKGKYDENPLYAFEMVLINEINNRINNNYNDYEDIQNFEKIILEENGCIFTNDSLKKHVEIMNGDYNILFIVNANGNSSNIIYDFLDINGNIYFTIFLDFFKNIKKRNYNSIISDPDSILGKSIYVSYLKTLAEIFIISIYGSVYFTNLFLKTSIYHNFKSNIDIFAGAVLYNILGSISPNDFEGCFIDDFNKFIDLCSKSNLAYYGIKNLL